jgi:hypothetical protein
MSVEEGESGEDLDDSGGTSMVVGEDLDGGGGARGGGAVSEAPTWR